MGGGGGGNECLKAQAPQTCLVVMGHVRQGREGVGLRPGRLAFGTLGHKGQGERGQPKHKRRSSAGTVEGARWRNRGVQRQSGRGSSPAAQLVEGSFTQSAQEAIS